MKYKAGIQFAGYMAAGMAGHVIPGRNTGITLWHISHILIPCRGNLKGDRYDGTATADFYVTGQTTMPASLVECGFMDSSTDIKYILDPVWSKKSHEALPKVSAKFLAEK